MGWKPIWGKFRGKIEILTTHNHLYRKLAYCCLSETCNFLSRLLFLTHESRRRWFGTTIYVRPFLEQSYHERAKVSRRHALLNTSALRWLQNSQAMTISQERLLVASSRLQDRELCIYSIISDSALNIVYVQHVCKFKWRLKVLPLQAEYVKWSWTTVTKSAIIVAQFL